MPGSWQSPSRHGWHSLLWPAQQVWAVRAASSPAESRWQQKQGGATLWRGSASGWRVRGYMGMHMWMQARLGVARQDHVHEAKVLQHMQAARCTRAESRRQQCQPQGDATRCLASWRMLCCDEMCWCGMPPHPSPGPSRRRTGRRSRSGGPAGSSAPRSTCQRAEQELWQLPTVG